MVYFIDNNRHLICYPYTIKNLHKMADKLGLERSDFKGGKYSHYLVPEEKFCKVLDSCELVPSRVILRLIKMGNIFRKIVKDVKNSIG